MADFSKPPQQMLSANLLKGYVGVHIEQGVPVLDRDLNLLNDLISSTVRAIVTRYIGNGTAAGAQGFAVQAILANNDFRIAAGALGPGTCLVGGIEVTIAANTNYSAQAGVPALTTPSAIQPDPRTDLVYVDAWLEDVDGVQDGDLLNTTDVGMQTSVRQRPTWRVRVAEGVPVPTPAPGHFHYTLARIVRPRNNAQITATIINDMRQAISALADVATRLAFMEQMLLVPSFLPSPNQFNPKFGAAAVNVTLFGNNFNIGTVSVRFGATVATIVGTPTDAQIIAKVPTMAAGAVTITVQTDGGLATSVDTFTVLPPPAPTFAASPNQFNPKFGPAGTNVTLFGNNFNVGTVSVRFGTTVATI
ncbi:MAG TPA: IPT/TIG domain-containing protein, partial [Burkholderiales bacterium]|nr:IPT/TIG domain-containing protein [Burkholderiales bacterium]